MAEEQLKQHELQRSAKQTYPFSRERSFVRPQSQYQQPEQYYYHLQVITMPLNGLYIYRCIYQDKNLQIRLMGGKNPCTKNYYYVSQHCIIYIRHGSLLFPIFKLDSFYLLIVYLS